MASGEESTDQGPQEYKEMAIGLASFCVLAVSLMGFSGALWTNDLSLLWKTPIAAVFMAVFSVLVIATMYVLDRAYDRVKGVVWNG